MANVGSGAAGKTLIGAGVGASPTFADIGTNSGLTSKGVLLAQGNSAFQATAAATDGQLLVGVTGSNPTFSTTVQADISFQTATAGATRTTVTRNTDNTNTSSNALFSAVAGGASGGDGYFRSNTGVTTWSWGGDNSDSDAYVLSRATTLGTNNVMRVETTGEINFPLQPAFLGQLTATDTDVTGDGTVYTFGSGNTFNEFFDQNSDFTPSTATFTAPTTGRYHLDVGVYFQGILNTHTSAAINIVTSNRSYQLFFNPYNLSSGASGLLQVVHSCVADMDAADTFTVTITVSNGTKVIDIAGGGIQTRMGGWQFA